MKKLVLSVALCLALVLSACGAPAPSSATQSAPSSATQPASSGTSADSTAPTEIEKTFGTFTLPQGWIAVPELSKGQFYYYVQDGTDWQEATGNISVSYGLTEYVKGEETEFAEAVALLNKSEADSETVTSVGEISTTKQGLTLITMTQENKDMLSTQYYIMGELQFVLVQAVDFYDEQIPDLQQVALDIVDSFVWADKAE